VLKKSAAAAENILDVRRFAPPPKTLNMHRRRRRRCFYIGLININEI